MSATVAAASAAPPIAIIGAGFSGTITALHVLRTLAPGRSLLLCERAPSFGTGTAYSTLHPDHLLNVRAANMSAFGDQPDGFEAWLATQDADTLASVHSTDSGRFAPRALYGRYLTAMLERAIAGTRRLQLVSQEVVDLEPMDEGYRLHLADGGHRLVARVVLAVGNLACSDPQTPLYWPNAWAPGTLDGLRPGSPLMIVGTGLTTMDLAVALHRAGFPGPVLALSRRGLLPREHRPGGPWPRPAFSPAERGSVLALLRRLRREVADARALGCDWRSVVDSIRPDTAGLWRGLTDRDRARFLRHLRPFWDVHRHRLAPPIAAMVTAMLDSGFLRVVRGRFLGVEEAADGGWVVVKRRGHEPERIAVQRVINATGVESASRCRDTLLQNLLARGLVRLDRTGLGLQVTEAFQAVDREGCAASTLWAIGPIVRGEFWECTAVPDIRAQAARLAPQITR